MYGRIHEALSTRLTPPSRKRTVFRGALMSVNQTPDPLAQLQQEYRKELESFYAWLKLAPPYHSVEKAIQCLGQIVKKQSEIQKQEIIETSLLKWSLFQKAFIESGLVNKHRGIIAGLVVHQDLTVIPKSHQYFIQALL